ncbi:hypothetical protein N0V95_006170 [Ascochyta clinopodiicola]|nr:hypothetical protein N0V95_006170 [Ascochyta clinopodiicola]
MTGDTFNDEKPPQTPVSPTKTDTSTLRGDAIIEIGEVPLQVSRSSPEGCQPARDGVQLDEITELEKELDQLDWDDHDEDEDRPRFREIAADHIEGEVEPRTRRVVLREIKSRLMEYAATFGKQRFPHNDFYNTILIYAKKYFRTPELAAKTVNTDVSLYSASRIDKMVNIFITFVIFILLVIPIVTMYHLTSTIAMDSNTPAVTSRNTFNAVGVLIVFTLLFSAAMSVLTKAARHEMFAASAAYCAILVVFIGNFTGPNN